MDESLGVKSTVTQTPTTSKAAQRRHPVTAADKPDMPEPGGYPGECVEGPTNRVEVKLKLKLEPSEVVGDRYSSGELMLLVKWKGLEASDWVPAKQANVVCPQLVIQFYKERLTWEPIDVEVNHTN